MTLNDLERRDSLYFVFFTEFDCFAGQIRDTSQWLIMYVNIVSQFQSSTFGHNQPTLQLDLSAIAELFVK